MRLAICISGLARTYQKAYRSYIDHLYGPNRQHHDIDVFISTWQHLDSNTSHQADRHRAGGASHLPEPPPLDPNDLYRLYRPIKMTIDADIPPERHPAYQRLEPRKHCHGPCVTNVAALLAMLYKIYRCDRDRQEHERSLGLAYDIVVRTRFDLDYGQPLIIQPFTNTNDYLRTVVVPSMTTATASPVGLPHPWTNDKFAYGSSTVMSLYSNLYNAIDALHVPVQPEILLRAHLDRHRLNIKELGKELDIIR